MCYTAAMSGLWRDRFRRIASPALPVLVFAAFVVAFADGTAAAASREQPRDELDRWVPSLAVFGGFQQQEAEGEVDSGMLLGPQCVEELTNCEIDRQIQPSAADEDQIRRFRAGLSIELMTPRFVEGLGEVRAFAHVDPMLSVGFERKLAGDGNPGPMIEPDFADAVTRSDANAFTGQGTRVLAEPEPFVLNVGAGLAFTFDVFDMRLRIKPSVEYLRERLEVTGRVNRVVQVDQIPRPDTPEDFRLISLSASDLKTYHALGPGLEVEIDSDRFGPFVLTPFVSARAYRFFGDLDVTLNAVNEFGESAEWRFDRDPWQWAARFGLRLRWLPE